MTGLPRCHLRSKRYAGFTLAELLVVVAIIGIVGVIAIPLLSFQDSKKLDVAAEEVGNALRFAIEGGRSGAYILVDAKTAPGRLKVVTSDATGAVLSAVNDPLTKRALDIDIAGGALSGPVGTTPRFMQGGTAYSQLLIGPAGQLQVFDGPSTNMGVLQAGSGIVLSLGTASVTVTINESTGLVAIP
jgi:prepilin-type N-terminal cleavage/methylation domain-containing protein